MGQGISGQTTTIVPQAIQTASPTIPGIGGTTAIGQLQQLGGNVPAAFASLGTPTIVSSLPNTSLAAPASSSLPSSLIHFTGINVTGTTGTNMLSRALAHFSIVVNQA